MYLHYRYLNVHVWDSDRAVIRAARRKIAAHDRRDPAKRDARKRFYREMLRHHASDQNLVAEFRL
ncbi:MULTISPECIES: hypothetical protein [unclassified Devosia]|uniref:hypothetical protein n=1 Tax=unclassified Devosia TaxID=196773 RepID=UPI00086A3DD6|nr:MULTISPECIES: hypothetical protein [unclassified Devosia]MBN9362820.1 hypothetical protein [Devosia sp.]ODS88375.1 MAG: hypothetical protein ABS47_09620 [Devosia sp. SCN 66-27]OJX23992.1 MAG: hypothetical protein BGO83_03860 [Devosia sp. 66-14]